MIVNLKNKIIYVALEDCLHHATLYMYLHCFHKKTASFEKAEKTSMNPGDVLKITFYTLKQQQNELLINIQY